MKKLFDFKHIKGDVFGGITAGIVALPLALAFGVSSGLEPSAGLYGAIFVSFFAALFGGTSTQISGPTAPMTAVSMVVIADLLASHDGSIEKALPYIILVFLMAGLIQVLLGVLGVGKYIKYIPYPVVSGFMTAIGVIILVTQILPSIGYYPKEDIALVEHYRPLAEEEILEHIIEDEVAEDGTLVLEDFSEMIEEANHVKPEEIQAESMTLAARETSGVMGALKILPHALKNINWLEFMLALGTIIIIFGFKKITKVIPSTLVALVVMSGIAYGFGLDYRSIDEIPSGFPIPHLGVFTSFSFGSIGPFVFTAITLALLGSIDSLLTSVVADNMTKTRHNPNKELIGQGIGNSVAAIFGGIPGAGATIRTVVNINAGGKTKLSGMISAVLLLIVLVGLGPVASKIPAAVLAGILVTVGIGVMDYKGLKAIPKMPRQEVLIMLTVLVLASVWNLVAAVGIGLVIASLMFMKQIGDLTSRSSVVPLTKEPDWKGGIEIPQNLIEEVYVKHVNGPLFFGSTSDFQALAKEIPDTATAVVIRLDRMRYMDQSGLFALEDVLMDLKQKGIQIVFINLKAQPEYLLEKIGVIPDLVPKDQIFDSIEESIIWIKNNVNDVH